MEPTMNHESHPIPPTHPMLSRIMAALPQRTLPLPCNQDIQGILSRPATPQFQLIQPRQLVMCPPLQRHLSRPRRCRRLIHTTVVIMDILIQTDPVPLREDIQFTIRIRITHLVFHLAWLIPLRLLQILGFLQWKDTGTPVVHRPGILIASLAKSANMSC